MGACIADGVGRAGHPDGTPYTREGGHEAITVFEFEKTEDGVFAWAKPVYMYRFSKVIDAGASHILATRSSRWALYLAV